MYTLYTTYITFFLTVPHAQTTQIHMSIRKTLKNQRHIKDKGLAVRLKKLHLRMGFSLRQMSYEFRVTHGAIQHWESGLRAIPGPVEKLIEIYEDRLDQQNRSPIDVSHFS